MKPISECLRQDGYWRRFKFKSAKVPPEPEIGHFYSLYGGKPAEFRFLRKIFLFPFNICLRALLVLFSCSGGYFAPL